MVLIKGGNAGSLLLTTIEYISDYTNAKISSPHWAFFFKELKKFQMSFTCSSNQVHNSADSFESLVIEAASPRRAQGMRYCNKSEKSVRQLDTQKFQVSNLKFTLPLNCAASGDVPAHNCVNAPYEAGYSNTS